MKVPVSYHKRKLYRVTVYEVRTFETVYEIAATSLVEARVKARDYFMHPTVIRRPESKQVDQPRIQGIVAVPL